MITYTIKHHVKGRIKVFIPLLKKIPVNRLYTLASIKMPEGIKDIRPNPITGNVVINYDPSKIDIEGYLYTLAMSEEIQRLLEDKK